MLKTALVKAALEKQDSEIAALILTTKKKEENDLREQKLLNKFRQLQESNLAIRIDEV